MCSTGYPCCACALVQRSMPAQRRAHMESVTWTSAAAAWGPPHKMGAAERPGVGAHTREKNKSSYRKGEQSMEDMCFGTTGCRCGGTNTTFCAQHNFRSTNTPLPRPAHSLPGGKQQHPLPGCGATGWHQIQSITSKITNALLGGIHPKPHAHASGEL